MQKKASVNSKAPFSNLASSSQEGKSLECFWLGIYFLALRIILPMAFYPDSAQHFTGRNPSFRR
jgi:hypothetical protein